MNINLISLMPCTVCFVFAVLTVASMLKKQLEYTTLSFLILLLLASAYFYIDANLILPTSNYRWLVILDIFDKFICLSLLPLSFIFISRYIIGSDSVNILRATLNFSPALIVGSLATFVYLYGGIDNMAAFIETIDKTGKIPEEFNDSVYKAQQFVCSYLFTLVLLVQMITFVTFCLFNFRRSRICLYFLLFVMVCGVRVGFGRNYLIGHPNFSCILSLAICVCAAAIFAYKNYRDEKRIVAKIKQYYEETYRGETVDSESDALDSDAASIDSDVLEVIQRNMEVTMDQVTQEDREEAMESSQMDQDSQLRLAAAIRQYVVDDQNFLNPQLNIEKMAEDLGTNHTYISFVLRYVLGSNFRAYINQYRIEFSKKLMQEQPDLLLEDVATQSGYTSSAQFVKKFKEIEGVPPRRWQHGTV